MPREGPRVCIGIDLLAAQSPHHGRRGIGAMRGGSSRPSSRAESDGDHCVLYRRPSLMDAGIEIAGGGRDVARPAR